MCFFLCFFWCKNKGLKKNPAYGRHRISQPMRIDAPIQKKKYITIFFFFRGFGLEGGGCCALYSRALVYIISIKLYCSSFPCCALHCKVETNIYSFNAQEFNSLDCIKLWCIANCWFALQCNELDCTAPSNMHYTEPYGVKFLNLL